VLTATGSPVQVVAMIDVEMTVVMPVATTIVGQIDITGIEVNGHRRRHQCRRTVGALRPDRLRSSKPPAGAADPLDWSLVGQALNQIARDLAVPFPAENGNWPLSSPLWLLGT
jgi:hypothetical protein